ncbi:TIGR04141 family sporadically distributed protein [Brumimicrobium oceani]|uniref:TIGR04141 family sporadically distributed protein n=1 Tax=Brumimicrobium oceani TaxID=2100725 RepID=A0A2U2XG64_9FLAO|nr:TIGR04141 family sporadically distributed protein [Brumimicrobium oceani]PWH86747.1 hypothetical protein DIT68_00330 [Brumimicrobium oceani]
MKQNPTIYKIESQYSFKKVYEEIKTHLVTNGKIYKEKDIVFNENEGKLIVIESDDKESEWSKFFPTEYVNEFSLQYKMPSLVLLINTSSGIFSIVGGAFYKYLIPYLDQSYGLNTYSRIMSPAKDEIISIKTRGVTGLRAGMQEQFKDNYRIMDYIKFGKIPTELKIKLSNEKADLLFDSFITSKSPHIILNISTGFNLNKKLSFSELCLLIETLEYIETIHPNDFFSSYKEITDKNIIAKNLEPGLINLLFNERKNIIKGKLSNFEICYPGKIEEFYSADEYIIKLKKDNDKYIKIGTTSNKTDILRIILEFLSVNNYDNNLGTFKHKIYNIYILTYKNRRKIFRTALLYHLNSELHLKKIGTYIFLDSKWYKLREIFIVEMNNRSAEILSNHNLNNSILSEKWRKNDLEKRENEADYNDRYLKDNYLVLDRIIVDSIELADVLHIEKEKIYLCHVKYGFSTEMRELYSQITSSARRLKNDLKDDENTFLKSIFKQLLKKERNNGLTEEGFINLFKTKKIIYVMAITGHLLNKHIIKDISKYSSNIAKISLIQCYTEMRTEYYDLSIEIIDNSECF